MRIRIIITLGIIFILNPLQLFSQSDYRDGYIVNKENDTIFGLLDYNSNTTNSYKCVFKKDLDSNEQIFSPKEIKGYRFTNDKYYVSKTVPYKNETRQLFLEFLINGIVDIYYYQYKGEHYLIDPGSGKLYELENDEKEFRVNNVKYSKKSEHYRGILKSTFKESPSINKKVDNIGLNRKSLINITRDYHMEVCSTDDCIVYEKKLTKTKKTFGVLIGVNNISITKSNDFPDSDYYLNNLDFGSNFFPSIGMYYKINIPKISNHTYFQYEGTYSYIALKANSSIIESFHNSNIENNITMKLNSFNNMFILKHEYSKGKIRPAIHYGVFFDYFFITDYNRDLEVKFSSGTINYNRRITDNPFNKFDLGINLGLGLKTYYVKDKEIFLDIKYKRGLGLLPELNTNTFLFNIGLQIGE